MAWGSYEQRMAFKVIGTVETSLRYDAINYADPITVGIMQWYGPRAAAILRRMRDENPSAWTGVESGIANDLSTKTSTRFWEGRHLDRIEGNSLKPVLRANIAIQMGQFVDDLDDYLAILTHNGIDYARFPKQAIFFMTMYHQSPKRAITVLKATGASSLDRLLAGALNNSVLGRYATRYRTAYNLLVAWDASGIPETETESTNPADYVSDSDEDETPAGIDKDSTIDGALNRAPIRVARVDVVSPTLLYIVMPDGERIPMYSSGQETFYPYSDTTRQGADVPGIPNNPDAPPDSPREPGETPIEPGPDGTPPPPLSSNDAKRAALVQWMLDREGRFRYGQNSKRLDPDRTGSSDCSGTVYRAYLDVTGINISSGSTRDQVKRGKFVKRGYSQLTNGNGLLPGDLIFYHYGNFKRPVCHVEMYIGNNQTSGHGGGSTGTKKGPTVSNMATSFRGTDYYEVRRHLD